MSIEERKQKLHSYIDMLNDEDELEALAETIEVYSNDLHNNVDELTPAQSQRLEEALEQVKSNKLTPHIEVMKREKKWPTK